MRPNPQNLKEELQGNSDGEEPENENDSSRLSDEDDPDDENVGQPDRWTDRGMNQGSCRDAWMHPKSKTQI